MLLTEQASALTGAPGAVLLYAVLSCAAYPRGGSPFGLPDVRHRLRFFLAGFWALASMLQLRPFWWQSGQIAQTIAGNEQPGTLGGGVVDGSLAWLAQVTANNEAFLNSAIILIALALAAGLVLTRPEHIRPILMGSILLSLLLWWSTEAFGLLLSGSATDPNSGPLLVVLALACWQVERQRAESFLRHAPPSNLLHPLRKVMTFHD
jgi:hypothetical protein